MKIELRKYIAMRPVGKTEAKYKNNSDMDANIAVKLTRCAVR